MISDDSIKNLCCGCGTCSLGCPQKCIQMIVDDEGFYKPVIDRQNCIECGRCKSLCPMLKQRNNEIINT